VINNIKYLIVTVVMLFTNMVCYSTPPTDFFNTIADGDWNTTTVWDTGTIPPTNQTGGNDDITIDHNITLTGNLDVKSGTVITINVGDTLTINGDVEFNNGCTFIVNGVLIINGNVTNNNNSDGVSINGSIVIDGDYDGGNGSDLTGTGDMDITGSVSTDGDATVFGSDSDCVTDCDNSADSPLPIDLLWFVARYDNEKVLIEWATSSEINNDYFEVYKMVNDSEWELLDTQSGAGNSSTTIMYSMVDYKSNYGHNYYKLAQVDFDGSREEFNVVTVYNPYDLQAKGIKIYPNPVSSDGDINVELVGFTRQEILIVVMDVTGKIFYEKAILTHDGKNIIVIDSKLDPGTYLIVGSEKNELYKKRLIIKG
jgi:hypothetical protein